MPGTGITAARATAVPPGPVSIPLPSAVPAQPNTGVIDVSALPHSASAPAQLACTGKPRPPSGPFLVSPYSGWTEVMSFVDHDQPDYSIDGKIVLANGLTASASDGQESDIFPAYWSTSLRQYVNYDGHNGYDFGISYQPVLAAAAGTIEYAGWNSDDPYSGYGEMVLINHHNGYITLYGHLSRLEVKKGDRVSAGQEVGISGSTGHSTGPHLHFSVFHNCNVTDPYGWTGTGRDPLRDFDPMPAQYLWLPGHDPLVLNQLPRWPTYPLGLHIALHLGAMSRPSHRAIPPADRLLLLALPQPPGSGSVSAGVALARTEASITQEAENIAPQLDDLQAQGLIDSYQVVPAAAAVWVRGTASADELESLPGVASLTGVTARDLTAAQVGLAHSVLIQIANQRAPSLWPAGFRSALNSYRPVTTVVSGDALVSGFGMPGAHVILSLRRRGAVVGVAEASSDAETGGFVAMLHDAGGNPTPTHSGDTLEVNTGGRTERIAVLRCRIVARSHRVTGHVPGGSSVSLTLVPATGNAVTHTIMSATAQGRVADAIGRGLAGGTLAVGSIVDAAGDEEAVSSFVPGIVAVEGSSTLRGWSVGFNPRLRVIRRGAVLFSQTIHAAPDGAFRMELSSGARPVILSPGDEIVVGSRFHPRAVHLPPLLGHIVSASDQLTVRAPARADVMVALTRARGGSWNCALTLPPNGLSRVSLPGGAAELGDVTTVSYVTPSGDTVQAIDQIEGIVLHDNTDRITGRVAPGTSLSVHVLNPEAVDLAHGLVTADANTGRFTLMLHDGAGRPVSIHHGESIVLRENNKILTFALPAVSLGSGRDVTVAGGAGQRVLVTATTSRSRQTLQSGSTGNSGLYHRVLPGGASARAAASLHVVVDLAPGVSLEKTVSGVSCSRLALRVRSHSRSASSAAC